MNARTIHRRRHGFSLIEVLFAIFISAICAVILASAMPAANNSRGRADLNGRAASLAQKMIEAVRGLGYPNATPTMLYNNGLLDSVTPIPGTTDTYSFTNVDSTKFDNPSRILPQGEGRITLENVDIDLRRVTVEVRWMARGRQMSVRVGTLIANL